MLLPDDNDRGSAIKGDREGASAGVEVWTIGHSSRSIEEFLGLLSGEGIEVMADVRRFPGSRANPQFNPEALVGSLGERGMEYVAFPELGGRRKPRADSENTVWRNEAFRGYADYMETPEFTAGLARLAEVAGRRRTAVLCAEAVWWRCHRSMIADALKARGARVWHILGEGKVVEHPYTSAARIVDGRLTYGPAGE